jgi:hypothetical protein
VAMYARGLQSLIFDRIFKGRGDGAQRSALQLGDLDTDAVLHAAQGQQARAGGNGAPAVETAGIGSETNL